MSNRSFVLQRYGTPRYLIPEGRMNRIGRWANLYSFTRGPI
ncbi:hypothetical protein HMPREF3185_00321 [Porphyromonas somerae]|uniref:Uncharacterized protein n=1 Tax=Porphyromonas somerae TaxID=322095 RepID=A0A134BDH7_9PORP|nr:hypothetical protein HMPREF3184_00321 [Porphyromonadaceae bacterium KA00676]KXB77978.1 hypothetical protein HMPREF3185_00321 [Porphyromonas somerae]